MNKYLIRLDDACPTMDKVRWRRMEELLDKYGIKPLVGIVPACKDPSLMRNLADDTFWQKAQNWQVKGWTIALHGYDHCYDSDLGLDGLNPMWKRSEFAAVPLDQQKEKIRKGLDVLHSYGLEVNYFFAPSHTFDRNTLVALQEESYIRIISDTIGRYPYKADGFVFIPQIFGHAVEVPLPGVYTFCYHPNTMRDNDFNQLELFIKKNRHKFISFKDIDSDLIERKKVVDRVLSFFLFFRRRLKGLN